jgi:hypothetical protein
MLFGYGLKQCQRQGVAFQLDRIRLHFGNVLLQKDAPSEAANRVVVDRGHLIFFTEEEPTVLPAAAPRGNTNITVKPRCISAGFVDGSEIVQGGFRYGFASLRRYNLVPLFLIRPLQFQGL